MNRQRGEQAHVAHSQETSQEKNGSNSSKIHEYPD